MKLRFCNISYLLACMYVPLTEANPQQNFKFSGEVKAGLLHNSSLSVDELDEVSSEGDSGNELSASINASWQITNKTKLASTYSYSQQNYDTYSQYDLALHHFGMDTSHKMSNSEVGIRIDGAKASVSNHNFLTFYQLSGYFGYYFKPESFLRTSFKLKTKYFDELTQRDAIGFGASVNLFHFINGANTMFMVGLDGEQDNAQDNQFDNLAVGINTQATHKFSLFGLASKLGIRWRYQNKDYQPIEQSSLHTMVLIERDEIRQTVQANWSIYLIDELALTAALERGDYRSQLESQTYQQNIARVNLSYTF